MLKFYFKNEYGEPHLPESGDAPQDQFDQGPDGPGYRMQLRTLGWRDGRFRMPQDPTD